MYVKKVLCPHDNDLHDLLSSGDYRMDNIFWLVNFIGYYLSRLNELLLLEINKN